MVIPPPGCKGCGAELDEKALFCSHCGTRASISPLPSSAPAPTITQGQKAGGEPVISDGTVAAEEVFKDLLGPAQGVRPQPVGSHYDDIGPTTAEATLPTQEVLAPPQGIGPLDLVQESQPIWVPPGAEGPSATSPPPVIVPPAQEEDDLADAVEEGVDVRPPAANRGLFKKNGGADKTKHKKARKDDADEEEQRKARLFKEKVNGDGYYDDRRPIDDELTPDELRKGLIFRMVLGAIGILLFALILIQLQRML